MSADESSTRPTCAGDLREAYARGERDFTGFDIGYSSDDRCNLAGASMPGVILQSSNLFRFRFEKASLRGAKLNGSELSRCDFSAADLEDAHLESSVLVGAKFAGANLCRANLANVLGELAVASTGWAGRGREETPQDRSARQEMKRALVESGATDFGGAYLLGAELSKARLAGARFDGSNLQNCKLEGADLSHATFKGAVAVDANFTGATLAGANFEGADLRHARGMLLDRTRIKDAAFSPMAPDPWSELRRNYSGPMLILHLLLLVAFLIPRVIESAIWLGIGRTQTLVSARQEAMIAVLEELRTEEKHRGEALAQSIEAWSEDIGTAIPQARPRLAQLTLETRLAMQRAQRPLDELLGSAREITPCLAPTCREFRVWQLLLGMKGRWFAVLLAGLLLVYNACRGYMTWRVSLLRDAEERSGQSPALLEYRMLSHAHRYFMRAAVCFAMAAVVWHTWEALTARVWLPS